MRFTAIVITVLLGSAACANPEETDAGPTDSGAPLDAAPPKDAGFPDIGADPDGGAEADASEDSGIDAGEDGGPLDRGVADGAPVVFVEVAYAANADDLDVQHLYLTRSSTETRQVTPQLAGGPAGGEKSKEPDTGGLQSFVWGFGGSALLYEAQQDTFDFVEVYSAEIVDARPLPAEKISLPAPNDQGSIRAMSPTANAVLISQDEDYYVDLSVRPLVHTQFNQGLSGNPTWAPNGESFAYGDIIVSADDRDLWFYHPATGTRERVNPGANLGNAGVAHWTADSSALIYSADENGLRDFQIFSVPVSGATLGTRTALHAPLPPMRQPRAGRDELAISPDDRWVAFKFATTASNVFELAILDRTLPFPQALDIRSAPLVAGEQGVARVFFNQTSDRLAFTSQQGASDTGIFLMDPSSAGAPVDVSPTFVGAGQVEEVTWARDGEVLLYRADDIDIDRLYAVDATTMPPSPPVEINPPLVGEQSIVHYELVPGGRHVWFRIEDRSAGTASIWSVDLRLTPPPPAGKVTDTTLGGVWCWKPDGSRVVFSANLERPDTTELWLLEPGLAAPLKIGAPMIDGARVFGCSFPPR
jgi:hypothetical protein